MIKISGVSKHRCHLGEGPLWDPGAELLYWIDCFGPLLYRYDFHSDETNSWRLPGKTVGSLAVREQGGLLLAMDQGFYTFSPETGQAQLIAQPLAGRAGLRFNDGKVDPFGSFVAGGMNSDYRKHDNCPMLRLSPEFEVSEILDGFTCFNGPCFSTDGERLYVTGRADGVIEVFDYGSSQMPHSGAVLVDHCNPDGATVDAEGYIWSAQWTGERILRIAPDGEIDTAISIPGQIVSSVMFGGPELDLIYVTTVGAEVCGDVPSGKNAGMTLVIEGSGFRGRAEPCFKG
ncbi:MAG: SMP-30/gluconolactonase/LRE family protein [Candidatus Tectomicrobia bacterium]|nr:SMP-30/gluconolactonase/LRE family protein [Candidatus Tectomicrobia bacterium]